ncbi:MAG: TolB family protein [Candidatus Limnocylindria bacterium]
MRRLPLVLAAGLLAAACGTTAAPQPAGVLAAPSAATAPTAEPAVPSPTASPGGAAPVSAGAVPAAGIVYLWGADDGIYRYDGATGALARVWAASTLTRESAYGPYVLGRHGGMTLLKWDGTTEQVCGGGFSAFATRETCAYTGGGTDTAVYTSYTGADGRPISRMILPADWGAGPFAWDVNGLELAIVRGGARPEPVRQHSTLWVMDLRHGGLKKVFDSASPTSSLSDLQWSGRRISFLEYDSTSVSASADGANIHLWVIDVDTGRTIDLGHVIYPPRWSSDGRLAFVRGGDRFTWTHKELAVLDQDWSVSVVAGGGSTIALAPAWQPVYRDARLAWIDAPDTTECCQRYVAGIGPSAQRTAVLDTAARRVRMTCPGLVTEGVRWAADGRSVLLLCRAPGVEYHALEVWYAPLGGAPRALVTGLGGLGFGYYGKQPSLLDLTAWSLADR